MFVLPGLVGAGPVAEDDALVMTCITNLAGQSLRKHQNDVVGKRLKGGL